MGILRNLALLALAAALAAAPARAGDDDERPDPDQRACVATCRQTHRACIARCPGEPGDNQGAACRETCGRVLVDCACECGEQQSCGKPLRRACELPPVASGVRPSPGTRQS